MILKKSNLYLIIPLALILGMLADYLFYQKSIGVSFFVFSSVIIVFVLMLAGKFDKKISKIQYFILILAVLFSVCVFLRSSSFLSFFNFYGSVYLLFLFFALFLSRNILNFSFSKYIILPLSFFIKSFREAGLFIEKCKSAIPENKKFGSKEFRSVVKGIIIAAPFLIILCWLLSSADLVFQAYLGKMFNFDFNLEIILRTLMILVFTYFFLGVFSKITGEIQDSGRRPEPTLVLKNNASEGSHLPEDTSEGSHLPEDTNEGSYLPKEEILKHSTASENKSLGFIESSTVLILIELLLLSFIAIQFFYLFGGKDYVWGIEEYITYSQYAKKGFYELIMASIVSFLLLYGLDKSSLRKNLKEKKIFKVLSAILILEMSVIIYSAWTRMAVYVDGYGLTFSRFLVFVFLLWIFSVFLIFLSKKNISRKKRSRFFVFYILPLNCVLDWNKSNKSGRLYC